MNIAKLLILIFFSAILTFASSPNDAIIKEISFTGNKIFSSAKLLDEMNSKTGSVLSASLISKDVLSILSFYHRHGYILAKVTAEPFIYSFDSTQVTVLISIEEGLRLTIGKIRVTGNTVLSESDVVDRFQTKVGELLSVSLLEDDIDDLIREYGRKGFPFASVEVQDINVVGHDGETNLEVTVSIDEGKKVTIDQIDVVGNATTEADVIIRESRIRKHELYNREKIDRIANRLRRLAIFSRVEEPEVYHDSYGGGIVIRVVEGNSGTFDGIAGYAPLPGGSGIFTGMIDLGMRNLFGTGRKIRIRWFKDDRNSQEINLRYVEPWIFRFPLNLAVGFDQRQQDSTYVRRSVTGQVDLLVDESITFSGSISQEKVIPSNVTGGLSNSSCLSAGIEIGYDTRDAVINPGRGLVYSTHYTVGRKRTALERNTLQRIGVDLDIFLPVFRRQVIRLSFHGRTLSGGGLELGDLYQFGGTNTLRGYREYQFFGKDIMWTNAEYRFIMSSGSFVYGFLDSGYFLFPADVTNRTPSIRDYLIGYGVGIRMESILGNIGVSLGYGEGDSFLEGKVHFGIVSEF